MNIGEVIKYKRQKRNMTQAELAALLSVTPQAVSRWEIGISYPDIAMVPKISEVLEVSADELLGIKMLEFTDSEGSGSEENFSGSVRPGGYQAYQAYQVCQPYQAYPACQVCPEYQQPALNQSQVDSIFDYVPVPLTGVSKKVLVVDDADFLRMMLNDILTRCGHTVLQARNGQECLEILQSEKVDVCVLDIVMPVMDGITALEQIKKEYPEIKTIMLSALSWERCVKQALLLGADAFVVKPFQEQCLIERIG